MDEHPRFGIPGPTTAMLRHPPGARAADPRRPKHPSHTRPREDDSFVRRQLFGQMHLIEPHVSRSCERDDRLPGLLIHGIARYASPIAMRQCRHPALPKGSE